MQFFQSVIKQFVIFSVCLLPVIGYAQEGTPNTVAILYGNGSSGKTSLSKEILKRDASWVIIDEDDIYIHQWLKEIEQRVPCEYKTISSAISYNNMFHAIKKNFICFNNTANEQNRYDALKAIQAIRSAFSGESVDTFREYFYKKFKALTLEAIEKALNENRNVILDRWYLPISELEAKFDRCNLVKVLVFSPLESSMKKFDKRNKDAFIDNDANNYRIYKQLIPSYVDLYQVTGSPEKALFSSTKGHLDTLFDIIYQNLEVEEKIDTKTIVLQELSKAELNDLKNQFIPPSFTYDDIVYISPKDDYHLIINTQTYLPSEAADEFLTGIKAQRREKTTTEKRE